MRTVRQKFNDLKKANFEELRCSLAILKEGTNKDPEKRFKIKFISIDNSLEGKLKKILKRKIDSAKSFEAYDYECAEPDNDSFRTIEHDRTNFQYIIQNLESINPEDDKIEDMNDLISSKSYMIILNDDTEIKIIGYKTVPPTWKAKKKTGLYSALFKNNQFVDIIEDDIFSIYQTVDFIYFEEELFILSKKQFEQALKFKEGMLAKAKSLFEELDELDLFENADILKNAIGDRSSLLRKIATIKNLGHYKNKEFLSTLKSIVEEKGWNIQFKEEKIIVTEDSINDILSVLQDKRLYSLISKEDFDVESKKPLHQI